MWATNTTLGGCHLHGGFRSSATAIFRRAVMTHARATWNRNLFGNRLVARDLLLNHLRHPTFTALRVSLSEDFFGDDVILACFHLPRLGAILACSGILSKHTAAGSKAE